MNGLIGKKVILMLVFLWLALGQYREAPYAQWAHSHVVWINSKEQNQSQIYNLIKTYQSYNIPVGGVNIDSAWSQCINNFVVNRKLFPNAQKLVKDMHSQNIKVILWATSIINRECPQYKEGKQKGYFLNGGKTAHWWHGDGAFIDFFNPEAKKWFQGLMDRVINMGFDGWKCDGADPLIVQLRPWPYSPKLKRYITYREYANQYYGTFYNYTKSKNNDTLIMARPVDSLTGNIFLGYAPKYVMFAGWVGDQNNNVQGFKQAMINIIHSASRNYLNFGFDIGGYKTKNPSYKWLFIRWTQVGSLLPFMENGGNGLHQPWKFDQQAVDIYRKFVMLHYDLKPFFLTAGTEAYSKGKSVLQPVIKDKSIIEVNHPENLGYVLWDSFLVSPIFDENGYVQVIFPKGHNWMYYFNHALIFNGGTKESLGIKLDETAFFIRLNTIVPIGEEMWLVYIQEGTYKKTIIRGTHSDNIEVDNKDGKTDIKINRFYKNDKSTRQEFIKVRIISEQTQRPYIYLNNILLDHPPIINTEYTNQFYIEMSFGHQYSLLSNSKQRQDIKLQTQSQ